MKNNKAILYIVNTFAILSVLSLMFLLAYPFEGEQWSKPKPLRVIFIIIVLLLLSTPLLFKLSFTLALKEEIFARILTDKQYDDNDWQNKQSQSYLETTENQLLDLNFTLLHTKYDIRYPKVKVLYNTYISPDRMSIAVITAGKYTLGKAEHNINFTSFISLSATKPPIITIAGPITGTTYPLKYFKQQSIKTNNMKAAYAFHNSISMRDGIQISTYPSGSETDLFFDYVEMAYNKMAKDGLFVADTNNKNKWKRSYKCAFNDTFGALIRSFYGPFKAKWNAIKYEKLVKNQ